MIKKYSFFIIIAIGFFCGNPSIKRELIRYSVVNHRENNDFNDILVFQKNGLFIYLESITGFEMEDLAERLNLYSKQKIYRLPGLSFFKFRAVNKSNKPIEVNLFELYFIDEFQKKYKALSLSEYYDRFTSVSYDKFNFDFMYSFYLIKKDGAEKSGKVFYFEKTLPENKVKIPPDSEGFQIVPFEFFSSGSRKYRLLFSENSPFKGEIEVFYYGPIREDIKRSDKKIGNKY
ncbi:MAG: hypothetical protein OEZ13_10285 [Spirochaetia bacterium]|nr:hypothetical protein [Spirochaetia bacterium]